MNIFSSLFIVLIAFVTPSNSGNNKDVSAAGNAAGKASGKLVTIFNGKTFKGWRGYNKTDIPALWTIQSDGSMKINGSGGNEGSEGGGDILYDKKVKNFEFEVEWKVLKAGANSGIMYLAQEIPGQPMYLSSPEYQVYGNSDNRPSKTKSGSLYDMIAAEPQNAKPIGEWNKAKIVVNNGKVTHYQNDVIVVEYTLWTQEWEDLLNNSKFSKEKWPLAYQYLSKLGGENKEGYIGFQDHGHEVFYRNIKLKELK